MQVLDWDGLVALVDEINNSLKQKVPITRTVNSKALIENISLDAKDVGAVAGVQKNGVDLETDNNNKVNIEVPEKTSDLINDSGFVKDEDINFTGGTGISVDGKVINHTNSIRAGTATGTSGQLVNGDTINIPTISYDTEGHIVDTGTTTVTLPVFSDTDEKVATEENDTTKAYLTGTVHSGAYIGTLIYDANIYLDITAGTLTAKIFKGDLTGNADTATVSTSLQISQTNPDSATSYYIPFGNISSGALNAGYNNGLQYRALQGTTSSYGYGEIYLGNSTASGTAGNKYGLLRLYGNGSNYWNLSGNRNISSNYTVYMPNSGGSLVVANTDAAVGSSTQPVYISASGMATAITGSAGNDKGLMYLNNGIFTTSNASLGSITEPLYLNNGEFTSCNVADSSSATPIDTNNALITARNVYYGLPTINGSHDYTSETTFFAPTSAGTSGYVLTSNGSGAPTWTIPDGLSTGVTDHLGTEDVGSEVNPIYLEKGRPIASTATIGGDATPVYLNSGTITQCAITDATSATALSTNNTIPTTRAIYYGLPVINGTHSYNSLTNIYAPTTEGTNGYVLTSTGVSGIPDWMAPESLSVGTARQLGTADVGSETNPIYLTQGIATASTSTVGGSSAPVYLNSGTLTQCSITDATSATALTTGNTLLTTRAVYYGLPTINGTHNYNSSTNIYAPTTEGTNGFILLSSGSGAPDWITPEGLSVGTAAKLGSSTVGSSSNPIYINSGSPAACGYSFSDYLPLSGGTMTGTIAQLNLTLNDGNQQIAVVQMFDEGSTNGSELVIGANGNTFIGSGESYKNLRTEFLNNGTANGESYSATSERLYVTSDTNMYFYSNGNTIANRLGIAYDSDGALRPLVTGTRSLGTSSIHWATAFIDDIQGNISNADVAAKLGTATVGGTVQPIYLNSGSPIAITATVGSTVKPIYLNAGALTASDATIGSAVIPIYMTSGTLTASTSTVGSSTKPIYLNNGALTVSDSTVGGSAQPVYLNSGMITPISTTAGSTTQPVYLNAGVITAMSGTLSTSYGGTGNTSGRATYVSVTNTNPTSSTSYYPTWVTGTSSDTNYSACVNNGFRYNTLQGDAETDGYGRLYLGNSTVSGESGNKYGMIRFYGLGENYWTLSGNKDISSNYTIYFPSSGGGLVVSSYGSAVGSSTKPVYISSSGVATASSSTVGSGVIPTYLSSGTITASTSTVGSSVKPIYLNSGTITASSSTVGSATTPVYLNAGTITACSNMVTSSQLTDGSVTKVGTATVGGTAQGIYLSSGTPTALSATIGSTTQPVYMSSGTITACSTTVGSGTKPIYSSSGVLTASSSTVGSSTTPIYMSSGTITAGSEMVTLSEARTYTDVTLSISDWSGTSAPYSQSVTVADMDGSSWFYPSVVYPASCSRAEQKTIAKSAAYIYEAEGGSGTVTFRATEKPDVALTIRIQGVI